MATWVQRDEHVLDGLTEAQRSRVVESLHSGYLEGVEPTEGDTWAEDGPSANQNGNRS